MPPSADLHRQDFPVSALESPLSVTSNVSRMAGSNNNIEANEAAVNEKEKDQELPKNDQDHHKEHDDDGSSSSIHGPQYAEYQACPLPELAVDPQGAPEPISNLDDVDTDRSTRPVVQPDVGYNEIRSPAVVYAEPDRSWFAKHKSWVVFGLVSLVLLLSGVIAAVVITHNVQGHSGDGANASSTVSSVKSTKGPSSVLSPTASSATGPAPTGSSCSSSLYVANVSWMGVADSPGNWTVSYTVAHDAATCCKLCYEDQPEGCDGWAYMPSSNSPGTTCNMIVGYVGPQNDSTCPFGHTGVKFNMDATDPSYVGGAGPCATVAS